MELSIERHARFASSVLVNGAVSSGVSDERNVQCRFARVDVMTQVLRCAAGTKSLCALQRRRNMCAPKSPKRFLMGSGGEEYVFANVRSELKLCRLTCSIIAAGGVQRSVVELDADDRKNDDKKQDKKTDLE